MSLAATRLAAIAFDRALHGRSERYYRDGELVMGRKMPSDYLRTWLLARLDPLQFGSPTAKALAAATARPLAQLAARSHGFAKRRRMPGRNCELYRRPLGRNELMAQAVRGTGEHSALAHTHA